MYKSNKSSKGSKATPKTIFHTPKGYGGLKNSTYVRDQPK
jgi:hypothetical protein